MEIERNGQTLQVIGTARTNELATLRSELLNMYEAGELATVDLSETRQPDVYLLQLLWRALTTFEARGRKVSLISCRPFDDLMKRSGAQPLFAAYLAGN